MAAKRSLPSQQYLQECLHYDPDTGALMWRERPSSHFRRGSRDCSVWNQKFANEPAGCVAVLDFGVRYYQLTIDNRSFRAHRIIWKIQTGVDPTEIDHRNLNGLDNRWANLREATALQNKGNLRKKSYNTSGFKGVSYRRDRGYYRATIRINGRLTFLGHFTDPRDAHEAYCKAAREYFGEFWHP